MDKKIAKKTFRNVLLAGLYILGISQLMYYGEDLFGKEDNSLTPVAVLLLFSLSAAVVGGLVFGQAVMLFLDNKKSEAVKTAFYSVFWLFVLTIIAFIGLFVLELTK